MSVHPTACIDPTACVGEEVHIWHYACVREHAQIGFGSVLGQGVYIDAEVQVGRFCKIQNYACLYRGVVLEEGVFVGPHVVFTNDLYPRAISQEGELKQAYAWTVTPTLVQHGASIGAHATVVCGVTIGRWAMVAAGAVVTRDVPPYTLVRGVPARCVGLVSPEGPSLR